MKEQRRFMGKNNLSRPAANGQQLVLHTFREHILPLDNAVNLFRLAQLVEHRLGNATLRRYFRFDNAAIFICNRGQFRHIVHPLTSQQQSDNSISKITMIVNICIDNIEIKSELIL